MLACRSAILKLFVVICNVVLCQSWSCQPGNLFVYDCSCAVNKVLFLMRVEMPDDANAPSLAVLFIKLRLHNAGAILKCFFTHLVINL